MTNAAPDTLETRAEVARTTASRAPVPTTRLPAGEHPPAAHALSSFRWMSRASLSSLSQVFRHVFPGC